MELRCSVEMAKMEMAMEMEMAEAVKAAQVLHSASLSTCSP